MKPPTDADSILKCIDRWDRNLFAVHDVERRIMEYANGGLPPSDTCDDDVVPLGFASSRLKREMEPLLDPLMLDPGFVHMRCVVPAINDAQRTSQIEMQVNAEVNAIVRTRMQVPLTQAAGRATVTGRAFLYRTSPNDWVLKNGRMLYPEDAGVDIQDSTWREWSFPGRISLRDIEERIKGSSEGKPGWNKTGLENLKKWILAGEADKYRNSANTAGWMKKYDRDVWAALDLTGTSWSEPVDVYWYFRKNGKITTGNPLYGGHEGVDLYCISRFGSQRQVAEEVRDQVIHKKLTVAYPNGGKAAFTKLEKESNQYIESEMEKEEYDEPNERLLFYMPNVFASIESCLVFHNDDASVAGDQLMSEVRGGGKTMMPKLAVLEGLFSNLVEGVSFASQVTWSVQPGVGEEYLQQLQRGGMKSGQAFPAEVQPMAKQNSLPGFGPAVQAINLLDQGISADSGAAQTGAFGGNKAEFASQALADQNLRQSSMGRRMSNWLMTLSKVATIVTGTLCRHWPEQRAQFPCFPDASRLRINLSTKFKIHEDEWDFERWDISARRLAGDMTRDQAVMVNTQLIQVIGPIMPSILPFLAKEILRARLGDTIAYQLTAEDPKKNEEQEMEARENCAIASATAFPPPIEPMSDPMIHSAIASKLAEDRIKSAGAAGSMTGFEQAGILAIIQYAAAHVTRVPEQLAKPALDRLSQLAKAAQSIPLTQPPAPEAMSQNELVQAQLKAANNQRLEKEGAEKLKLKENDQLMKMRSLGNSELDAEERKKTLATQRASEYQRMAIELKDANSPDTPTVSS